MDTQASDAGTPLGSKLHAMRLAYLQNLPEKIRIMQDAWQSCFAVADSRVAFERLYHLAHNLAGSGATFGYTEVTVASRQIMQILSRFREEDTPGLPVLSAEIAAQFSALYKVAETAAADETVALPMQMHSDSGQESHAGRKLIYLVDDDEELSMRVAAKLHDYGYEVVHFPDLKQFRHSVGQRRPDAILMDMILPEGNLAGAESIMHLLQDGINNIPVIFMSVRDDLDSRLSAVRAGGMKYLTKPIDMQLLQQCLNVLTRNKEDTYRLLLVDDDEMLTELYEVFLHRAGFDVTVLNDPVRVLQTLQTAQPELILLDVNMPVINGLEIGAVIRQYEEYTHIPIVFLTADMGMDKRLASMHLGGDDFLNKPVDPDFLVEVLRARISKSRALKSGEQRIKQALHELQNHKHAQDGHSIISVTDAAGNIIEVNSKFSEISGYSKEELVGKNHRLLKSGYHPTEYYDELWHTISSGKIWHGVIKNRKKNGGFYWVDATITPILDEFGVPEQYVSVRTDITQLKELEYQLREEQERLNLAMDATSTGMWEWNMTESKTYYNDKCRELLGLGKTAEISWPMMIHPDDYAAVSEKLMGHIIGAAPVYVSEHRKRNAAGGWEWVYESGRVVDFDQTGQVIRIIGTMQIINERKELEALHEQMNQQLLKAAKMEAIGHLTGGVAHDFNNILGGMLGYAELAETLLGRNNPNLEKIKNYLIEIRKSGARARDLVAQMLVFTKLAPGDENGATPAIWLKPMFKEIVGLLHSSVPATISLNFHLPPQDLQVVMQPVHLHQILLHLGINARNAIGEYGSIDFSYQEAEIDYMHCASCAQSFSGKYVEISVRDSGRGISAEQMKMIFEPVYASTQTATTTGIGLPVVHGVVHGMGGHILVESATGVGTTVRILLPWVASSMDGEAELKKEAILEKQPLSGLRVMVVDDEHTMAAMLSEYLNLNGATVATYTQSGEALREFLRQPGNYDIVITDQIMPEQTGLDMAEKMLGAKPELPIILCTGYSEELTQESVAAHGISLMMRKPLKVALLVENMLRLTGREIVK